jgi:phenol hydroxylase P3 protein
VPIVQRWIDKWFWRGYRLLTLVAMMHGLHAARKVMSWKEAWEMYAEENGAAPVPGPGALRHPPAHGLDAPCEGKRSHQPPGLGHLLQLRRRGPSHLVPERRRA